MQSQTETVAVSRKMVWTGRVISGFVVLFFLFDGILKALKLAPAVEASVKLGYPESAIFGIGILLLVCTVLYTIPQTAVLGAILLTGYLGGATATQVRVGADLFPILFPGILGAVAWLGIYLRDARLRALISLRS